MTYLSQPVLDILPDFTSLRSGMLDDATFEGVSGIIGTPWKVTDGPRRTVAYPFTLASRDTIATFRRFAASRYGRLLGFWLPVYLLDYKLISIDGTEVAIEHVGLTDAVTDFSQFKHIAFYCGGILQIAEIDSVETDGSVETITLTSELDTGVEPSQTLCGGAIFARFTDDELSYEFASLECAGVNAKFIELPKEYESAETGSVPIFLYKIERGATTWRYTNWALDLSGISGSTWQAADISHGAIRASQEFVSDGIDLTVTTDESSHPFRYFRDSTGSELTTVTIYQIELGDTVTGNPIYKGRIHHPRFGKKGQIQCQVSSALRVADLQGPRIQVQRTCNHRLYDAFCGLNEATFTTAGTIDAISSNPAYIEATEFGTKATAESDPNWFALGKVKVGNETRTCVGQDGERLYLNAPFSSAVTAGATANARAGCDKRSKTCEEKFSNLDNYLGFDYVPSTNPQFEALETPKPSGGKKA